MSFRNNGFFYPIIIFFSLFCNVTFSADLIDLTNATVVSRSGSLSKVENTSLQVLIEEVEKRTKLSWDTSKTWPQKGPVISLTIRGEANEWKKQMPLIRDENVEKKAEAFRIKVDDADKNRPVVWIIGADGRGLLYGVGQFLRLLDWEEKSAFFPCDVDIATAPAYPIRGHQLGYRATANSYDAWDAQTYEQYIRDLALFGTNCIENIPFQDEDKAPLMPIFRDEMNIKISDICDRYDLDYWVWTPAVFDLNDKEKRAAELKKYEVFYKACPRLNAVFFPGGDPGDNPPQLVMPFLKDIGHILMKKHAHARVWISLQGFDEEETDYFFDYVNEHMPDWLGGLVAGPSSPPIAESRKRLPQKYRLRSYPDITHTVRCQYPVAWWDMAYNLTLGRECPNPQPVYYKLIHNWFAPYTDGFLSYSDGIHDDVNKVIWSALGWSPNADVRDVLEEYAHVFFRPDLAESAADGILALEKNWEGPLAENGSVEATLAYWQKLRLQAPELKDNWRWQLCQLRATYDAYTRHRLLYETELEEKANVLLAQAPHIGADAAMNKALDILNQALVRPVSADLREDIDVLCEALFQSIGLQTSVTKYQARGGERGAILDYVGYPLNNRWWIEDEFKKIRNKSTEEEKLERLEEIRTWEHPGEGSYYDDVGNVAKCPHVVRGEGLNTDPEMERNPNAGYWWWNNGFSRRRLSWQVTMDWPIAVTYENLDPNASYIVRMTGFGEALTRMNGQRVDATVYGKEIGEIKEFPVPKDIVKSGKLKVTWGPP